MTTFKRDPKFTPSGLSEHQLARIERLADAIVVRNGSGTFSKSWDDAEQLASWWFNSCRSRQHSRDQAARQSTTAIAVRKFVDSDDAWRYLVGCILWVIACGLKRGGLKQSAHPTSNRAYWAQVRGSY